jgi:hypothetical protein
MVESILHALWTGLNSGAGLAVVWIAAVVVVFLCINKLSPLHKAWEKYEGTIITAIKLAEREIPDDTPDQGLARLDAALRFVLAAYADANDGAEPSAKLVNELREGIQIKHAELERGGNLTRRREGIS